MKDDEQLIAEARERFREHLDVTQWWRMNEVKDGYAVYDGDGQWKQEDLDKQYEAQMPAYTVNKVAPVVDSIAGFEIQNRSEIQYVPRMVSPDSPGFSDMMESAVNYIENDTHFGFEKSQAFKDMLICGVGATNTFIDYDKNIDGEAQIRRGFPGFFLWDTAARRKNLTDKNWCAEARIVSTEALRQELDLEEDEDIAAGTADTEFLEFFDLTNKERKLSVIYDYQWREKMPFYRVQNLFPAYANVPVMGPVVATYAMGAAERFKFDPVQDETFNLDPADYKKFKEEIHALGIECVAVKQKRYRYYRAKIVGDKVYDRAENYSQEDFSIQFMTGKYSEKNQCFYGVVRAEKDPQRLANQSISDWQGFLRTIPKGGVNIESDAVPDVKAFIKTYSKAKEVTVFNPNAISGGKVQPKVAPPMPQGLAEMVQFGLNSVAEVVGVSNEWMGISDGADVTAALQSQRVRQGLTVLATYFDAVKFYTISQGRILIDCVRILAQNSPGRLIRNVTGKASEQYFPLLEDNIAAEYDVIIKDTPQTPDEKQQTFEKLLELAGMVQQQGVNLIPLALQYAPLKPQEIETIQQMMQPPPPPEPDPNSVAVLQAEAAYKSASAEKLQADALALRMDTLLKQKNLETYDDEKEVEIMETASRAELNKAKTQQTLYGA